MLILNLNLLFHNIQNFNKFFEKIRSFKRDNHQLTWVNQNLYHKIQKHLKMNKLQKQKNIKLNKNSKQKVQKKFIDDVNTKLQVENQKLWKENMEMKKELSLLKQQAKIEIENLNDKVLSYEAYIKKMRQDFDVQMEVLQEENKNLNQQVKDQQQKLDAAKVPDAVKQWMQKQMN